MFIVSQMFHEFLQKDMFDSYVKQPKGRRWSEIE